MLDKKQSQALFLFDFKMTIFLICSQLMRHWLIELFHFLICFKFQMTAEWSTLSSWDTSYVVVRGSALMILSNGHCQLLMTSHCTLNLQGSCLLCKTSWTTTALCVCYQFLGKMPCWCWKLFPLLYNPFWTQIKKIAWICFLSNIISLF